MNWRLFSMWWGVSWSRGLCSFPFENYPRARKNHRKWYKICMSWWDGEMFMIFVAGLTEIADAIDAPGTMESPAWWLDVSRGNHPKNSFTLFHDYTNTVRTITIHAGIPLSGWVRWLPCEMTTGYSSSLVPEHHQFLFSTSMMPLWWCLEAGWKQWYHFDFGLGNEDPLIPIMSYFDVRVPMSWSIHGFCLIPP
jgi:hypothetical protein